MKMVYVNLNRTEEVKNEALCPENPSKLTVCLTDRSESVSKDESHNLHFHIPLSYFSGIFQSSVGRRQDIVEWVSCEKVLISWCLARIPLLNGSIQELKHTSRLLNVERVCEVKSQLGVCGAKVWQAVVFTQCVCVCVGGPVCICLALCSVQSEARRVHSLVEAALCYQATPLTWNITQGIYVLTQGCECTTAQVENQFRSPRTKALWGCGRTLWCSSDLNNLLFHVFFYSVTFLWYWTS